ncbi:MAG TPA: three component ABC system middle component [Rhizomicrobium sp.]|nr:three component ABC system middle component [Rhizomicrobium sp.]
MDLAPWEQRPREEAALFNPAFCGALTFEFVKAYQGAKSQAAVVPLIFCALPMALHPATRDALPATITNSLYTWIENNTPVLIGYRERARHLTPTIKEGLRFAMDRGVLLIDVHGHLAAGSMSAAFTPAFLQGVTEETKDCVTATRQIARWFAKAGAPSTILSALRVTL